MAVKMQWVCFMLDEGTGDILFVHNYYGNFPPYRLCFPRIKQGVVPYLSLYASTVPRVPVFTNDYFKRVTTMLSVCSKTYMKEMRAIFIREAS